MFEGFIYYDNLGKNTLEFREIEKIVLQFMLLYGLEALVLKECIIG